MCRACKDIMICDTCYNAYADIECMADDDHCPCNNCGNIVCGNANINVNGRKFQFNCCDACGEISCHHCNFEVSLRDDGHAMCNDCYAEHSFAPSSIKITNKIKIEATEDDGHWCYCGNGSRHLLGGIFCRK